MAEGKSVYQDDVICRYFLSGICKDGEKCLFSHDRTRHVPDTVCRYYLRGTCVFGQNCRYDHIFVNENTYRTSPYESMSSDSSRFSVNHNATGSSTLSESETNNWINAPEFVPRNIRSYADIVKGVKNNEEQSSKKICPLFAEGECPFLNCELIHGNMCELCQKAYLHPFNEEEKKSHIEKCEKRLEQEMEYSFAIQNSMNKTCGICMDIVMEKEPLSERRFGILENCNHVYCLTCIRKWRQTRQYESNVIGTGFDPLVTRACPECRIVSDFIIPSVYFVDTGEEKQKLIAEYKKALSKTHCKYFKKGSGVCPFGGSCFYLHAKPKTPIIGVLAKPDGTKVDLPFPVTRRRQNQDGDLDFLGTIYLWNFLEYREENSLPDPDMFTHPDTEENRSN